VDLLFLDANVLFSAAYHPDTGLRRLWRLPGVRIITSVYAAEEARRNLRHLGQLEDLEELLGSVEVATTATPTDHPPFSTLNYPPKTGQYCLGRSAPGDAPPYR